MWKKQGDKVVDKRSVKFPCIFRGLDIKPTDDRIQAAWKERHGQGAPFGSLRQQWRKQHCATINPYGSDGCPYTIDQCISAFEATVMETLKPQVIDSRVYFISAARSSGLTRAETKPSPRITEAAGPGLTGFVGSGGSARSGEDLEADRRAADTGVRTRLARPVRIGEMLRWPDGRPREGRHEDRRTDPEATDDPSAER
jgi:hypothetical protein